MRPTFINGDEIGLPGRHDPDCRRAFPWAEPSTWNMELREWYRQCIQLRQEVPALRRGDFQIVYSDKAVVVYQRQYQGQTAVIAFNIADQDTTITLFPNLCQPFARTNDTVW
ncbi:MAG: DUF3459 domain-containing protein [Anaerolineae bacterium]|nr:DUF3459 domain-containing protein [Anaerolineae bacterium]